MSYFKWCHGPECHTYHTVGRIRGVKGNKVLRTRKINQTKSNENKWYAYFCDDRCRTDYMQKHLNSIMQHEPRNEPLETSIEVQSVQDTDWWGNPYTYKKIIEE